MTHSASLHNFLCVIAENLALIYKSFLKNRYQIRKIIKYWMTHCGRHRASSMMHCASLCDHNVGSPLSKRTPAVSMYICILYIISSGFTSPQRWSIRPETVCGVQKITFRNIAFPSLVACRHLKKTTKKNLQPPDMTNPVRIARSPTFRPPARGAGKNCTSIFFAVAWSRAGHLRYF